MSSPSPEWARSIAEQYDQIADQLTAQEDHYSMLLNRTEAARYYRIALRLERLQNETSIHHGPQEASQ